MNEGIRLRALPALVAAAAVFGGAGGLAADQHRLELSAPADLPAGNPIVIRVTGANPAEASSSGRLDVSAIPEALLPACPPGHLDAAAAARESSALGGEVVATASIETVDEAGRFSMPIAFTPRMPGRFRICAYANDGAAGTLALGSVVLTVEAAP